MVQFLGICQCLCGKSVETAVTLNGKGRQASNVCENGVKKCGVLGGVIENECSLADKPMCLDPKTAKKPSIGGAATCQVMPHSPLQITLNCINI